MMENYLNIAEWGEGVFGAEAAAQKYFRKSAKALTRREAALLATALPNPIARNPGRPRPRHQALAARLIGRMEVAAPFSDCLKG
jgi:monofunctional biosynthetic peptidoglycan transglycosylase